MSLLQTWRWFGPSDPVSLEHIRMAGAEGIVSALHHIPNGDIWTLEEINKRKADIEKAGLCWSVIESIPVHEDIKQQKRAYKTYIEHYKISLRNVAQAGIRVVCYNFMPVLDWTRTQLQHRFSDGSLSLRFDMTDYIAFDVFVLERKNADSDYTETQLKRAEERFKTFSKDAIESLTKTILAGLPGSEESYHLDDFRKKLAEYDGITATDLQEHLLYFLQEIVPVAEENGIFLTIHPDDPPYSLFGLPRVVSTAEHIHTLLNSINSPSNGLCFCTGSLGASPENKITEMAETFANRTNFLHLRNVITENDGSFFEANHLEGNADMFEVMHCFLKEQKRREELGHNTPVIPFRPDHGHVMLDDLNKTTNPGYSAIGRLRGLAELRGLMLGIKRSLNV